MNSLVLLPFLAAICTAAPGGLHAYSAPAVVHAAPAAVTYTAQVQVPVTKTVHYDVKNVVTGYTSQIIKPAIAAHAVPALHVPAVAVPAPAAPVIVQGDLFRLDTSTPKPQPPSTPCFPFPGQTSCDTPQLPQLPQFPGQTPQPQPQPEPQPQPQPPTEGGNDNDGDSVVVESPDQTKPPQDPEAENPSSQPSFPTFPGGLPAFPSFPTQIVQDVNLIPEQKPISVEPAPAPVAVAPAPQPAPVAPAPLPVQEQVVSSDDTVLVENPEFRSAAIPAAPAAAVPVAHAPAVHTYAAPAPVAVAAAPAVKVHAYAAAPHFEHLVTKEKVLAPVRTHTQITPQVTQVQPEVTVRKVIQDVAVDTPVYHTPVVHKTHVNPPVVHHQTYVAPTPVLHQTVHHQTYAAAPAHAVVHKVHY